MKSTLIALALSLSISTANAGLMDAYRAGVETANASIRGQIMAEQLMMMRQQRYMLYQQTRYTHRGDIHSVRTYHKKNGTIVQRHLSGNPRSGIHCHNNMCV